MLILFLWTLSPPTPPSPPTPGLKRLFPGYLREGAAGAEQARRAQRERADLRLAGNPDTPAAARLQGADSAMTPEATGRGDSIATPIPLPSPLLHPPLPSPFFFSFCTWVWLSAYIGVHPQASVCLAGLNGSVVSGSGSIGRSVYWSWSVSGCGAAIFLPPLAWTFQRG